MTLAADWAGTILRFWFGEAKPEQWFRKDDAFDVLLRERFLGLHEAVALLPLADCTGDPRTALAAVIALDQLPRNMFRGTPRAFASDAKALAIAGHAVEAGFDRGMTKDERTFLYLPFEHAEDAALQARCVQLMGGLGDAELLRYAVAHKDIIDRFGRFPHRNAILGRPSTEEEIAFLGQPGSSF